MAMVWQKVKELKKLKKMGKFFVAIRNHFIFIYLTKIGVTETVYLLEVQERKTDDGIQCEICCLTSAQRRDEDELFYQEVLYRFCRERNLKNLPVYIAVDDGTIMMRKYDFPQMPDTELNKALTWEMAEFKRDYVYGYTVSHVESVENDRVKTVGARTVVLSVVLCAKDIIAQWREAVVEQGMQLISVFWVNEDNPETEIKINVDEEYLTEDVDFAKLKGKLSYLLDKRHYHSDNPNNSLVEFLPYKERAAYLNWQRINTVIIACLVAVTIGVGSYNMMKYFQIKRQAEITEERLSLLQSDIALMNDLKMQEEKIRHKQEFLQKIYGQTATLYPLLINLSATTMEKVKLVSVSVDGKQALLMGKANGYQAMAEYKAQFDTADFMGNTHVEIETSGYNQNDGFVDFTLKMKLK